MTDALLLLALVVAFVHFAPRVTGVDNPVAWLLDKLPK